MPLHLRMMDNIRTNQAWSIDDNRAIRLGIADPEGGVASYFTRDDRPTIWHAIEEHTGWVSTASPETSPFHAVDLDVEQFYPRIARPLMGTDLLRSPSAQIEMSVVANGRWQLTTLKRSLERICLTIHPSDETLAVYGHDIRNLLILAATEVEAHWRGVLLTNSSPLKRFTTADYVLLADIMRLREYSVSFPSFPWLEPIKPFGSWDSNCATKSLPWYDAYNATKHDRENAFNSAQLRHAFAAVAACSVMLAAQFTRSIGLGGQSELSVFFAFDQMPTWEPRESYVGFADNEAWLQISHPSLAAITK